MTSSTNKIYTKTGDLGETSLLDGKRVQKNHPRIQSYGAIDELNSQIGFSLSLLASGPWQAPLKKELIQIQETLFLIGSRLSCSDKKQLEKLPSLNIKVISLMESSIDQWTAKLPELKNFILPGGSPFAASIHLCRTRARYAERLCVSLQEQTTFDPNIIKFINRLSDYFFVLTRIANFQEQIEETIWKP